jgi:hypothetical protein
VELAVATAVAALGCTSAVVLAGGPVALGFALLTGFSTALLLKGDLGALRGDAPDEWLGFVGLGYLALGAFGVSNAGSLAAMSLSGTSTALVLVLLVALTAGVFFLGRGLWFVAVSR